MLGLHRLNAIFGAAPLQDTDPGPVDPAELVAYMRQLSADPEKSGAGLHLLLCHPGTDQPWDLRTQKQITAAEEHWQELEPDQKALVTMDDYSDFAMATTTSVTLSAWLRRGLKQTGVAENLKCGPVDGVPNVSCNIGASRVVVAEATTEAGLDFFRQWAAAKSGDSTWADPLRKPTVTSPGRYQFWFTLPEDAGEITAATIPGHMRIAGPESSFVLLLHSTHLPVPGSQIDGEVVRTTGEALDAPGWLTSEVSGESERRLAGAQGRFSRIPGYGAAAEQWSRRTSWAQVFEPAGWQPAGADRCGCPVFTTGDVEIRVTAHDPGCRVEPMSGEVDAGARFWVTPPDNSNIGILLSQLGRDTLTRFEVAAGLYCGGDLNAAVDAAQNYPAVLTGNAESSDGELIDDLPVVQWSPPGVVTELESESLLDTLDLQIVRLGPGTDHPLTTQGESWQAASDAVGNADLVVVTALPELVESIGGGQSQEAEQWILSNLSGLSKAHGVILAVIRPSD